jgi:hypothetical protein
MRFVRRLLPGGLLAVIVACGSETVLEPGALTITVSATPTSPTNDPSVGVAGQVTRAPAASGVPIVVTLTHTSGTVTDSADQGGGFSFTVALTPNAQNTIQLTATDASGSTATPVNLTVLHDDEGPRVSQVQPANAADGVSPAMIQVTLNEQLKEMVGAGIAVSSQGAPVAGTVALSNDSLTLTFTPAAPFVTNAIHQVTVGNYRDALGNLGTGVASCFVTGGSPFVGSDPLDDLYFGGAPPAALVPPDLVQMRVDRQGANLHWLLRFAAARSLSLADPNNLYAWVDLDTDLDGNTGNETFKDAVFASLLPASGTRAEYGVVIVPQESAMDSSGVGPYVAQDSVSFAYQFIPDLCGLSVGFSFPMSALGGDDGVFRAVGIFYALSQPGFLVDPAPDAAYYAVNLPGSPFAQAASALRPTMGAGRPIRLREWEVERRR